MSGTPKTERIAVLDVNALRAMAAAVAQAAPPPARLSYRPRFQPPPEPPVIAPPPVVVEPVVVAAPVVVTPPDVVVAPPVVVTPPVVVAPVTVAPARQTLAPKWRSGAIAALGVGAVVVTVLAVRSRSDAPLPRSPMLASVRLAETPAPVAVAPKPAPPPVVASAPPVQVEKVEKPAPESPRPQPPAARSAPARKRMVAVRTATAAPAPKKAAAPETPAPEGVSAGTNSELDQLVKSALDGKEKRGESHPEEVATPAGLTRNDILASMKPLRPRIKECYKQFGQRGLAVVHVQVGDKGQVASTKVEGDFAGSPTGACVEAAVKSVRFPQSAGMSFRYPFPVR